MLRGLGARGQAAGGDDDEMMMVMMTMVATQRRILFRGRGRKRKRKGFVSSIATRQDNISLVGFGLLCHSLCVPIFMKWEGAYGGIHRVFP